MPRDRIGLLLAGGTGSRLFPATRALSKQLLPVYDKPMVYYPLSVLMQAGLREIVLITTPQDAGTYRRLLGTGSRFGITLHYVLQAQARGVAEAVTLMAEAVGPRSCLMVLGDNLFLCDTPIPALAGLDARTSQARLFTKAVADPRAFGVLGLDETGQPRTIVEKPARPASNLAITGLYALPADASDRVARQRPSERGELEITCLLRSYLEDGRLQSTALGPDVTWLDTGTHDSLLAAAQMVRDHQRSTGHPIAAPELIAYRNGWIDAEALTDLARSMEKTEYGQSLLRYLAAEATPPCAVPQSRITAMPKRLQVPTGTQSGSLSVQW